MIGQPDTAAAAEAEVEVARADLAATLDQLKTNLQPKHLLDEVMARPRDELAHWLSVYGRFARHSPISGLIMGAAAFALTSSLFRKRPATAQTRHLGDGR